MRKLFLSACIAGTCLCNVHAQTTTQNLKSGSGFYVGVNAGYNLPITSKGSPYLNAYETTYQTGTDPVSVVPYSFGKGANFGINLGYMFTPNLGAELGVDYLLGSKTTFKNKDVDYPDYNEEYHLSGKMVQFRPAMLFKAGTGNVVPYAKVGVVIGVGSKITSEFEAREQNYSYDWYEEYSGGTAVGFHGALGVDYAINNKISLFGEVRATGLNYSPNKGKVTKFNIDGEDRINELDTYEREIEFVDHKDGTNQPSDKPRKELKFSSPFSNVGLNIGVKFNL